VRSQLEGFGSDVLRRVKAYQDVPHKPYHEVWNEMNNPRRRAADFAERALDAAVRDPRTRPR